jgi:hypothetical protein
LTHSLRDFSAVSRGEYFLFNDEIIPTKRCLRIGLSVVK